jgi:hypothetical protein
MIVNICYKVLITESEVTNKHRYTRLQADASVEYINA